MVAKLIKHKPTTPGKRGEVSLQDKDLQKPKYKKLLVSKPKSCGRNNLGRITSRRRGGGHKRLYRLIDFKRNKDGIPGKIEALEYDPNRSADIALILYADGERRYIITPRNLKVGDTVLSGREANIATGNCLPMQNIPIGTTIHCIELKPNKGAQIARSAGCSAQLLAKEGGYGTLRLKSGEMRKVLLECRATIGEVGKSEHSLIKIGKAGRSRWKNRRPTVRGVAMNPVDHPLGGGEGKTSGGRPPCSPWGLAEGTKTRKNKSSNKLIVRRRKRKTEK